MRKLNTPEAYKKRINKVILTWGRFLSPTSVQHARAFIKNMPADFDNSERWRNVNWGEFNYRYGLHHSCAGLLAELLAEVAWAKQGAAVVQHFSDRNKQTSNIDQTVYFGVRQTPVQVKSTRIQADHLVIYQRMLGMQVRAPMMVFVDVDSRIVVATPNNALGYFIKHGAQIVRDEIRVPMERVRQFSVITQL